MIRQPASRWELAAPDRTETPLKILQITSGRDINGALVYCRLLSQQLAAAGHEVTLLCRPGSWIARQPMPGVTVRESELERFPPGELRRIAAWIKAEGIQIAHSHMSRAHNFGALLARLSPVRSVATAHAQYLQLHWRFHDLVLANSVSSARFHRRVNRIRADRLKTVYCFADLERFLNARADRRNWYRRELLAPPGRHLIAMVGEVVEKKGHRYLFRALPEILRQIPDARVVLIGRFHRDDSCTRRLRKIQMRNQLFRRVHWLGRRENIHEYLKAMDVCVVPSLQESLGLVAVEAQAAGIPVVAARTGGLPEIVQHERTGLLVPPRDPAALAEAVIRLYQNPEWKDQLVAEARAQAIRTFDPERLTYQVIEAYEELLARPR